MGKEKDGPTTGFSSSSEVLVAFTADLLHQGVAALKDFGDTVITSKVEVKLLVACNDLASDPGVCAFICVGSENDLLHSNSLLKHLHEGDTVAPIIASYSNSASSAPLPTACIGKTPMEP